MGREEGQESKKKVQEEKEKTKVFSLMVGIKEVETVETGDSQIPGLLRTCSSFLITPKCRIQP